MVPTVLQVVLHALHYHALQYISSSSSHPHPLNTLSTPYLFILSNDPLKFILLTCLYGSVVIPMVLQVVPIKFSLIFGIRGATESLYLRAMHPLNTPSSTLSNYPTQNSPPPPPFFYLFCIYGLTESLYLRAMHPVNTLSTPSQIAPLYTLSNSPY